MLWIWFANAAARSSSPRDTAIRPGLYCSACGKWQKWLKKDEIRLFNHSAKVENSSLLERLKARIEESAIKVSTVKAPHTYMKAVGTRELEKILEEELGNEDTK